MSYRRLVGFGEAMLRMTVRQGVALETATSFEGSVGGAELNARLAAVRVDMPATRVSALTKNPLGRRPSRPARARHHLPQDRREFVGSDCVEPRVRDVSRSSP